MGRVSYRRGTKRTLIGGAISILLVFLAGCSSHLEMSGVGPGDTVDPVRNADLLARFTSPGTGGSAYRADASKPQIFPGADGQPVAGDPTSSVAGRNGATTANTLNGNADGGTIELNFENADIQTVAKTILSDALGLNFVVDPRVTGSVTLVSSSPIARKDLLAVFESALRMTSSAIVHENGIIKIVPMPEAAGATRASTQVGEPGFGVTIVPLHYTSVSSILSVAENFLSRPGALRADTTRNMLMVQGTAVERQNVVDMVSSFDVEWLRNQSVAIFPLKTTSPDIIIRELDRVLDSAEGGQAQNLIKLQPIARMNAVLVVAKNRKLLDHATAWISRLDRGDETATTVRIYRLANGNATKIAKILNDIFVGRGAGQATPDGAANQLAPGVNGAQSKLDSIAPPSNSANGANSSNSTSAQPTNGLSSANTSGGNLANSFDNFADKKGDQDQRTSGSLPKGVFQNVRITADVTNNSIVVFSNQEDYRTIERSIRELDRPQLQVAIEATVAEITLTDALQYGVQYYLGSTDVHAGANNGSVSLSTSSATALISQALPGLNVLIGQQASPKAVLSALSNVTTVKVLSAPSLVVADNQPAFLQVGDSVPISTGSATVLSAQNTVVNTITMQDTGIILKVWPHVHANGSVELEIEQEVSSVVGGTAANGSTNLNPTISQRRIHSTVAVATGQTVLLGGLISENDNRNQSGIPLLRQISGVGDLFGNTNNSKTRTEIIVFVKPRIIRDSLDAQNIAEEFRAGLSTMHAQTTANEVAKGTGGPIIVK